MDVMKRKDVEQMVSRCVFPGFMERLSLCCEDTFREEDAFLRGMSAPGSNPIEHFHTGLLVVPDV